MPERELKIFYHVFSDAYDEYFDTLAGAKEDFSALKKRGRQNIRIWEEGEYYENDTPTGEFTELNCIKAVGDFPM